MNHLVPTDVLKSLIGHVSRLRDHLIARGLLEGGEEIHASILLAKTALEVPMHILPGEPVPHPRKGTAYWEAIHLLKNYDEMPSKEWRDRRTALLKRHTPPVRAKQLTYPKKTTR